MRIANVEIAPHRGGSCDDDASSRGRLRQTQVVVHLFFWPSMHGDTVLVSSLANLTGWNQPLKLCRRDHRETGESPRPGFPCCTANSAKILQPSSELLIASLDQQ